MTLEQIMERLIKQGMPEDEARLKGTSIIANMDYDKTNTVTELQNEIDKKNKEYNSKAQDNKRKGGLYDPEFEKIKKQIDGLYNELDHELGIEPYTPASKALPAGPSEKERLIERYKKDLETMTPGSPMYKATKLALDKILNEQQAERHKKERDSQIERYKKDLETMPPGKMRDYTKNALDRLLQERENEEKKQQENHEFSEKSANELRGITDPSSIAQMMKKPDTKEQTAIVKYEKPDGVEDTPLTDIPKDVKKTKIEVPKFLKNAKEWVKNNKKKAVLIAAGAIALGVTIGVIAHCIMTGDASGLQNASQVDSGTIVSQITQAIDAEYAKHAAEIASNIDPSTVDISSQPFDASAFSGENQPVHFTEIHNDSLTTSPDYIIDHAELTANDGSIINTDGMTNDEVRQALESGDYRDITTYHNGVGMGHHTIQEGLDILNQNSQGGRSL